MSKENKMYKKHYDRLTGQWHVFLVHDGQEDYICSFDDYISAQEFCDTNNEVAEASHADS